MRESDEKYVMSLDVGTTTIRSMVYNEGGVVVGTAATPVRYYQVQAWSIKPKDKNSTTYSWTKYII